MVAVQTAEGSSLSYTVSLSWFFLPLDVLALLILQFALCFGRIRSSLLRLIRSPYPLNTQLKRTFNSIRQANADASYFLSQQFRLRLNDEAIIRAHEIIPFNQHRLPLTGPLRKQSMLMQIRRLHALRLQIYKIRSPVGLDPQRNVCVGVDVPQGATE